jgi:hypothetical protein
LRLVGVAGDTTLIVTSTWGWGETGTLCSPIVLIRVFSAIWRLTAKPLSITQVTGSAERNRKAGAFGCRSTKALAVELLGDLFRFALLLEIARFELDFHVVEARAVFLGGAQRLAFRQEKVAGEAVLDTHHVAHLAKLGDALEQDHFHCDISICQVGFPGFFGMARCMRGGATSATSAVRVFVRRGREC